MSDSQSIKLPTEKVKALTKNPKTMVIYGPPKVGKTTILSQLDNCLIIDLESGTDLIDALKVKVNDLKEIKAVGEAIKEAGKPYKYIAIDTITKLEEWCEDFGKELYKQTPMGKSFKGDSVLTLPNGAGYLYLRMAFMKMINYIKTLSDHIILVGHLKDKILEKKGKEVNAKDLDLTGKLRSITSAGADAIGYVYRDGNEVRINFQSSDEVLCGSRCEHLKGKDITFDWNQIYVD